MEIRGDAAAVTLYEAVGGTPFFEQLVEAFYNGVEADPLLRPIYPNDLVSARARLLGFLVQYWGGPTTYSDERGHPRLRMRHAPYVIGQAERDAWMTNMESAISHVKPEPAIEAALKDYFETAATHMINSHA